MNYYKGNNPNITCEKKLCGEISEGYIVSKCENVKKYERMGADAVQKDLITEKDVNETVNFLGNISRILQTVIVITGVIDIVVYDTKAYIIRNGVDIMSKVTGTFGIQLIDYISKIDNDTLNMNLRIEAI